MNRYGIASIGIKLPSLSVSVTELATLRGVDPSKYTVGLGCDQIALCSADEGVVELASEAAKRALSRWDGDVANIGLLAVGTETARDMSRPLSAFVGDALNLRGAYRSYEVKHACYGGTLALRQALEWKLSGASRGKAALVIASDVALYAPNDPGEPTQGAGAVAMIIDDARIAEIDLDSYAYAEPAFDFWRPVGERYPRVDGPFSLECYKRGAEMCFAQYFKANPGITLEHFHKIAMHAPFPKMVKKAFVHMGARIGLSESEIAALYETKVEPTLQLNRKVGNAYTASLWLSVASALAGASKDERFAAFSYGSGFGSELLTLSAGPEAVKGAWMADVEGDLAARRSLDAAGYDQLRAEK